MRNAPLPLGGKGAFSVVTQGRGLPLPAEGNHIFCVPSRETVRILASPFGEVSERSDGRRG